MAVSMSERVQGLHDSLFRLQVRVNLGKGLEPSVPYEKLYLELELYTAILGSILKDLDKRLNALELKAGARR